jgi:hypothetical protein
VGKITPIVPAAWAKGLSLKIKAEVETKFRADAGMQEKALGSKRREVIGISQGFYGGMVKAVGGILTNPLMRGFAKGGQMTQNVTLNTPNTAGLPPSVKMQIHGEGPWRRLNPLYVKGELRPLGVVSKSYWRKTGDLATAFRAARPSDADLAQFGKYARTKLSQEKLPLGYLAKMTMVIDFPKIRGNGQVDRLIRASFAQRVPQRHVVTKGMIDEAYRGSPLNHLLLAEGGPFARAWVARFAADAGIRYMEALRLLASR